MAISLENRVLKLATPLGADVLLPERAEIADGLSRPFECVLELSSESGDVDGEEILGRDVTLSFDPPSGGATRHFSGIVAEFEQTGYRRRLHQYTAVVRPWVWLLTRSAGCRIFQQQSVPAIVEQLVKPTGREYRLKLSGSYSTRSYCVQYRESDFSFMSRLLEQEGIHYFFEHSAGHHVMVLCDDSTTLGSAPGYEEIPFFPPDVAPAGSPRDHFNTWSIRRSVQSGAYATTDFDFEKPTVSPTSLLARAETSRPYAGSHYEVFDFPAQPSQLTSSETRRLAKVRIEELQAGYLTARGRGNAAGIAPGTRFKLIQHPRRDANAEYLVTAAHTVLEATALDAGAAEGAVDFSVAIEAVEAKTPFRPARRTPKPVIQGAQSALVVGKGGAEIDTDRYGRVKVQFPWDRVGKSDENSSCWVRVAQLWAGKNWGAIHVPRIGQEVLVSFLEGDPDRPIITGRVYNGESLPPYGLPEAATQSGFKSRSSKEGSAENANELRFEDKKGSEQILLHAEKDLAEEVEHDRAVKVGHDETIGIENDRTSSIKGAEQCSVGKDHETKIGGAEKRTVVSDRTTKVSGAEQLTVGKSATLDVGQAFTLKASEQITLETGSSKLVMKSDGTIQIQGASITIEGAQSLALKASSSAKLDAMQVSISGTTLEVKGTKASLEGTLVDVNATGIASLKGALTKIG